MAYVDEITQIIKQDDLTSEEITAFLDEHIAEMKKVTPPSSKHALDLAALRAPSVTFWSMYQACAASQIPAQLVACGALKQLNPLQGELKSMQVAKQVRGRGHASVLLRHIIEVARARGYHTLLLETGSFAFFKPARQLYLNFGFKYCAPFADYREDPNSVFMSLHLA